jgi:hypothetical protein
LPELKEFSKDNAAARRLKALESEMESFNNRFVVHDAQVKWNNLLRNHLIRYLQQVQQRRGFTYYMSQKAVKFLMDLVQEQYRKAKEAKDASSEMSNAEEVTDSHVDEADKMDDEVQKLIRQLLDDKDHFFVSDQTSVENNSNDPRSKITSKGEDFTDLNANYRAHNNYIFLLLGPQAQLQSEKNNDSAMVVSMSVMQLRIMSVMDNEVDEADVSAMLQRKFIAQINGAQFFHAQKQDFQGAIASVFTNNGYGAEAGGYWPPWVPFESLFFAELSAKPFARIVDKTSATLTYTKHNTLRIKKNERIEKGGVGSDDTDDRIDSVAVDFPKFDLTANSTQYYAMFTIVTDLLMYAEPMQKERNERIEKILLAADFSDLTGTPEMVMQLQKRIRSLNEFKMQFKLHAQRNDPQSKADEVRVERELIHCEEELFFLMKSVAAASQQKRDERNREAMAVMTWHMAADEILWHLIEASGKPFVDIGLSKASFQRTVNSDSSNFNVLEIEMLQGLNLSPKPIFTTLLAPYFSGDKTIIDARHSKMIRIYWYMLEAIGGIPVCDHFEVNLFPLRLQMEYDVGKKLLEYIFPDRHQQEESSSESESEEQDSSDDSDDASAESRSLRPRASDSHLRNKSSRKSLRNDAASLYSKAETRNGAGSSVVSLHRSMTNVSLQSSSVPRDDASLTRHKKGKSGNDLDAMMSRASTNMSLVYVKVPSAVLSLSYKGAKAKNLVDVTDFVFRFPTIEYRNKTWSYLDLVEHLKREVIKGVLAHTGSLLKDKMTHHRRQKPTIQRQLTSYKNFIPGQADESRAMEDFLRSDSAEVSSLTAGQHGVTHKEGGLLNTVLNSNPIGRHIQHLSHLARHRDGIVDDNDESKLKKTRMLLGKFVPKN